MENVSVMLAFFFVMVRCHRIDIICRCYSNIEICQFIVGDLQRIFEKVEKIFYKENFYYETGRVIEVIREIEIEDASFYN